MKDMVLILGMGRSGTSMLSGVLEIMGVQFGNHLHGPNEYNPHGHWENAFVVNLNERVIAAMQEGQKPDWALRAGGPPKYWLHPSSYKKPNNEEAVIEAITQIIRRDFSALERPALKDPRISILWPIWEKALARTNMKPKIIHIKRNPKAVAKSLYKFHDFKVPEEQAIKLCARYNSDVEKYCKEHDLINVQYEEIIQNPILNAKRISDFVGVNFNNELTEKIQGFVDSKLNHGS